MPAPAVANGFPKPDLVEAGRSSGHFAAEYIRSLIVNGDLTADERVPQDELAEVLQISRIPLREGLKRFREPSKPSVGDSSRSCGR